MPIKFTSAVAVFPINSFQGFCEGWAKPLTEAKLSKSDFVIVAYDDISFKPIGFITAISDNVLSAYIPLLEVLPDYRNQKTGTKLCELMLEKLEHLYMIDLCCDESLEPFYKKLNFAKVSGMVRRQLN